MEKAPLIYLKLAITIVLSVLMVPLAILVGMFAGAISGVAKAGVFALLLNAFKGERSE